MATWSEELIFILIFIIVILIYFSTKRKILLDKPVAIKITFIYMINGLHT